MSNSLKKISNTLSFIVVALACFTLHAATIREYNYKTDYNAAHDICVQHWKAFEETNALCSGFFDSLLFTFTPYGHTLIDGAKPARAKVLIDNNDIIGIAMYATIDVVSALLSDTDSVSDNSYGELSYIGIDEKHQGKGFGTTLFNACKEDLLQSNVKTILARISSSNMQAFNWHKKQGFVPLTEMSASNEVEEAYRIEGKSSGQVAFKLEVEKRQNVDWSKWKKYLHTKAPAFTDEKRQKILNGFGQVMIADRIANLTADRKGLLTIEARARIVRHYLIRYMDKEVTRKIALDILGKKKLDLNVKKAIESLFKYIDDNIEALGAWINRPEQIEKIMKETDKALAMDTFRQTEALFVDEQKAIH